MSDPIISEDGHWMWNGAEWIPNPNPPQAIPVQPVVQTPVANTTQVAIQPQTHVTPVMQTPALQSNKFTPDKKIMIIVGSVSSVIIVGVIVFLLLGSGTSPLVGTWVSDTGTSTYNEDGTVAPGEDDDPTWVRTWEESGMTLTMNVESGAESSVTTAKFEITNDGDALWIKILSIIDQDGNDMVPMLESFGGPIECMLILRDTVAPNAEAYNETASSYQSSMPSWC